MCLWGTTHWCGGKTGPESVYKSELIIRWLETVCFILDSNAVPLLHAAQEVTERVNKLREEKIADQDTIIKLQQKLLEKSDENFDSVKTTVQQELKVTPLWYPRVARQPYHQKSWKLLLEKWQLLKI